MKRTVSRLLWSVAALLVAPHSSHSQTTISLAFDSLPSAQGWTYFQGGDSPENGVFEATGTSLLQDTIGSGMGSGKNPNYAMFNVVDGSEPFVLSVRARVLAYEGSGAGGFFLNVRTAAPNQEYALMFTTSLVTDPLGNSFALDTTVFHDYVLMATPGSDYSLFIDGVLRLSGPLSSTGGALNAIQIGDGNDLTGNARAEVTNYVFSQGPQPCVYPFSSGNGVSQIKYCVSANGTIVQLQAPAGQEHIGNESVWEGYVLCSGTQVKAWDLSATSEDFGAPTLIAGPTGTGVTIRRSSSDFQLDQVFKLDKLEKDVSVTMTLTNISGATIPDVRIARAYDPDINNDSGDDLELKSARTVWAGESDAVTLTAVTWAVPSDTAFDTAAVPACSPAGAATPTTTGDASLANVTYRVGNMTAGAKKKIVFVYRVQ